MSATPITLVGNLTRDPEVNFIGSTGTAKLHFGVACEHSWRKADGEWESSTSFVNVVAWRTLAEQANEVLKKGMRVVVTGRLEVRQYEDAEGNKRSATDVIADDIGASVKSINAATRRPKQDRNQGDGDPSPKVGDDDDPWGN